MLDAYLRPIYQECLIKPILKLTKNTPPTTLTAFAMFVGVLILPALYLGLNKTAFLLLLLSRYVDNLDGNTSQRFSEIESILAMLFDRVVEFSVILGLFAVDPLHRGWLIFAMLGSCYFCLTCFLITNLLSSQRLLKVNYNPGMIERSEVFVSLVLMILIPTYFNYLAWIFMSLILVTSYLHLREFLKFNDITSPGSTLIKNEKTI